MPDMSTEEIYEAFGLEAPKPEPEKEEPEKPEESGSSAADNTGEDTADTGDGEAEEPEGEEPEGEEGEEDSGDGGEKKPLTSEERKANAARRREAEKKAYAEAAVRKALEDERRKNEERFREFFKRADLKNTFTEKPITSLEEFDEWSDNFEREKIERDLKAGKLTPEALERAVAASPAMKRAQELLKESEMQRQEAERQADTAKIEGEIAEIHKLDPGINSISDLLEAPYADKFKEYVRKGNSFIDAYYLANRESLVKTMAEKAREQAAANMRSKEHLKATGGSRGSGAKSVPPDVMSLYRELNPSATEAEIQAHYNKSQR